MPPSGSKTPTGAAVNIVATTGGQGFPLVQCPISGHPHQQQGAPGLVGWSKRQRGGQYLQILLGDRRGSLHAANPRPPPPRCPRGRGERPAAPTRVTRRQVDAALSARGRRLRSRSSPPPRREMEQRHPRRHLPRRPCGLSRRLPRVAARRGRRWAGKWRHEGFALGSPPKG